MNIEEIKTYKFPPYPFYQCPKCRVHFRSNKLPTSCPHCGIDFENNYSRMGFELYYSGKGKNRKLVKHQRYGTKVKDCDYIGVGIPIGLYYSS